MTSLAAFTCLTMPLSIEEHTNHLVSSDKSRRSPLTLSPPLSAKSSGSPKAALACLHIFSVIESVVSTPTHQDELHQDDFKKRMNSSYP